MQLVMDRAWKEPPGVGMQLVMDRAWKEPGVGMQLQSQTEPDKNQE